jgi:hypothetical protein
MCGTDLQIRALPHRELQERKAFVETPAHHVGLPEVGRADAVHMQDFLSPADLQGCLKEGTRTTEVSLPEIGEPDARVDIHGVERPSVLVCDLSRLGRVTVRFVEFAELGLADGHPH